MNPIETILGLLTAVIIGATAYASLRTASEVWYSATYTLTLVVLLAAVNLARYRRGTGQAFWFGFALFGWVFYLLGKDPTKAPSALSLGFNDRLLTSRLIQALVPYLRKGTLDLGRIDTITALTSGILHLLITVAIAVVGGLVAVVVAGPGWKAKLGTTLAALACLAGLAFVPGSALSPAPYFPEGAFGMEKGQEEPLIESYSKNLVAMGEPSLWALSERDPAAFVYRVLWLPATRHPVCLRITKAGRGAKLRVKVLDGWSYYDPGQIAIDRSLTLDDAQWAELERNIREAGFWDWPANPEDEAKSTTTADGQSVTIERVKGGTYHIFDGDTSDPAYKSLLHSTLGMTGIDTSYRSAMPVSRGGFR